MRSGRHRRDCRAQHGRSSALPTGSLTWVQVQDRPAVTYSTLVRRPVWPALSVPLPARCCARKRASSRVPSRPARRFEAGVDNHHPQRLRQQPEVGRCRFSQEKDHCGDRCLRLGQVQPGERCARSRSASTILETLSLYERQGMREGPEAPVESVTGLGVAITVGPERRRFSRRSTVGTATEIRPSSGCPSGMDWPAALSAMWRCDATHCLDARSQMWLCAACETAAPVAQPRHFSPSNYGAACLTCHGVGSLQIPDPEKLIVDPDKPLCAGAMYSPGFFPKGYLCQPLNGGYDMVQALARALQLRPCNHAVARR